VRRRRGGVRVAAAPAAVDDRSARGDGGMQLRGPGVARATGRPCARADDHRLGARAVLHAGGGPRGGLVLAAAHRRGGDRDRARRAGRLDPRPRDRYRREERLLRQRARGRRRDDAARRALRRQGGPHCARAIAAHPRCGDRRALRAHLRRSARHRRLRSGSGAARSAVRPVGSSPGSACPTRSCSARSRLRSR